MGIYHSVVHKRLSCIFHYNHQKERRRVTYFQDAALSLPRDMSFATDDSTTRDLVHSILLLLT